MGTHGKRRSPASVSYGLALLVAFAALVLAACGSSDTTTTDTTNTAAPSPAVAVTVSSAPTPTPTHTWTPGAKPIPAATFPAQEGTTAVGEAATGWVFTPTVDIQVTHLGYFDDSGDGLRHDHPAGIFDMATKKLLVKSIVRRQSPLEASYRFVKIAPVTLKAGREYAVVAYAMPPFDPEVNWPEGLVWAPEIEVGDNVYTETSKLAYPTAHTFDLYLDPQLQVPSHIRVRRRSHHPRPGGHHRGLPVEHERLGVQADGRHQGHRPRLLRRRRERATPPASRGHLRHRNARNCW